MEQVRVKLQVRGDKQKKDQHEKKSWDKGQFRELPVTDSRMGVPGPCKPHYMTVTGEKLNSNPQGKKMTEDTAATNFYIWKAGG